DAASGDPEMWKIRDLVNGGGTYLNNHSVLNYLELHDEAWPTSGGQRIVKSIDSTFPYDNEFAKGRVKLGQGLVLTAPGVPAFLMGAEWLEDTDFGTAIANRIDWSKKTTYAPIVSYFKKLIGWRRASPALWADAPHQVYLVDDASNLIVFRRVSGSKQAVVIANFANVDYPGYRIGLPVSGGWTEVLNSQSLAFDGDGVGNPGSIAAEPIASNGFAQSAAINIPRMGLVILAPAGIPLSVEGSPRADGASIVSVAPSPTREGAAVEFTLARGARARLAIYDLSGRRIATVAEGV